MLASEKLSLMFDAPHQRAKVFEELENDNERERLDYDRCVAYFESDHDDYIRDNQLLISY